MNKNRYIVFFFSFAALYIALQLFDNYYSDWLKGRYLEKPSWVINKKNQHYGIGFLGSSRAINMVNIDSIEKKTGYKGINMGSGGASIVENFITLKFFLDNNNKLDNLYFQVDPFTLAGLRKVFSYPLKEYVFFEKINDSDLSDAIKLNNGYLKYYFWKYIPFVRYAEFSHVFSVKNLMEPFAEKEATTYFTAYYDSSKGSVLYKNKILPDSLINKYAKRIKKKENDYEINSTSVKYLKKIILLANEHHINLVLYKAPIYDDYYVSYDFKRFFDPGMDSIAKETKLPYLNFQDLYFASDTKKFMDCSHLNEEGANIFSSILADSILKRKNRS
jgi:hypothetical protein